MGVNCQTVSDGVNAGYKLYRIFFDNISYLLNIERVANALAKGAGLPVNAQPVLLIGIVCTPTQAVHQGGGLDILGQSSVGGGFNRVEGDLEILAENFFPLS